MAPSQKTDIVSADAIREIFRNNPHLAEESIEAQLETHCKGMTNEEKITFIDTLLEEFDAPSRDTGGERRETENELLEEVFRLIFGKKITDSSLSSQEMLERLSSSMQTLFNTLNRIVNTINAAFLENTTGDQTIRKVIRYDMESNEGAESLEDFLSRIEKSFLVSHKAFKQAAHTIVQKMIREIEPEGLADDAGKSLKFGPMRKAEYFEIYKAKYDMLQKWFESGRFMNDLLREFENNCQASI